MDQVRDNYRAALNYLETLKDEDVTDGIIDESAEDFIINTHEDLFNKGKGVVPNGTFVLKKLNRELWAILEAKAEGEALSKINSAKQGEGLFAFVRMHCWFNKTTDLGKTNRRIDVMKPAQCKHA